MDADLIYTRTPAGEEAIRQRTRVMQRNIRMVLILVDGRSSFQDICLRTGNEKLTENALLELEKGGFIVSVQAGSPEPAAAMLPPLIESETLPPPPRASTSDVEINNTMQSALASTRPAQQPRPTPAQPAPSPAPSPSQPEPVIDVQGEYPLLSWSEPAPSAPVTPAEKSPPAAPSLLERLKAAWQRSGEPEEDEKGLIPRRKKPPVWRTLLLSLLILCAALALLVVAFPYNSYLPEIQAALTKNLGRPVRVARVQLTFWPVPTVLLEKVRIETGGEELNISAVALEPALGSWLSPVKVFRKVTVSGMVFPASALPVLTSIFETLNRPETEGRIESLRFEQTELQVAGLVFSGMEGTLQQSADGRLASVAYQTPDRSLKIDLIPAKKRVELALEGFAWRPLPDLPLLQLESVSMKGSLDNELLNIHSFDMRLLEGVLQGSAVLKPGPTVSLRSDLNFARINASRLETLFGKAAIFSGSVSGNMHLAATAERWTEILPALQAEGDFVLQRGTLKGIDLVEAVRRVASGSAVQGGATSFEQLSGRFQLNAAQHHYTSLQMNSGLLQAGGDLKITGEESINGVMELLMRGTANQTRFPITVQGPLQTPEARVGIR